MIKKHITRTYGPIHFEDLEPHRFEDLVRELIYDYKNWQSIEATGRSGNDEGFDIRAFEGVDYSAFNKEDENIEEDSLPMEGNLWMIQCKRELEVGPKKIESIVTSNIDPNNPPYGYILVTSANISKKSYDSYRESLKKLGVMEYYLWGKAELEDMLHMPKYDRILFTFFGISLISKKKSRTAEIRSSVNNKNKLIRAFGNEVNLNNPVLIRDVNDINYPDKSMYVDFEKRPRWLSGIVIQYHPRGIYIKLHEYFAYVDIANKKWDFSDYYDDLNVPQAKFDNEEKEIADYQTKMELVQEYINYLPERHQAKLQIYASLSFQNMSLIDLEGDVLHQYPHIYTDFNYQIGPFKELGYHIEKGNTHINPNKDGYERINIFPVTFSQTKLGKIYQDKKVQLPTALLREMKSGFQNTFKLYDRDNNYPFLNQKDIIEVDGSKEDDNLYIRITCKYSYNIKDLLRLNGDNFTNERIIEQTGRVLEDDEIITVLEFMKIYKWEVDSIKKGTGTIIT